jgi:peptide/nickel transport system substrate-binding protein
MDSRRRDRRRLVVAAVSLTLVTAASACSVDDGGGAGAPPQRTEAERGGEITYLSTAIIEHLDPQRVYDGRDIANLGRLVYRGLVMFPAGETDPVAAATPVPDLATDTGTTNEDATEWQFTVKDGARWQDGQPVTCEDFKYGVSRNFATDVIDGGPNFYPRDYLDIPESEPGVSVYRGPYTGEGQEYFDKAVTCDGPTITYRFRKAFPDFPLAVAALHAFAPFKQSEDQGDQDNFEVFSNGPYLLEGEWDEDTGGTFVRNPEWDRGEDANREANVDELTFELGIQPEVQIDRLIADGEDANTISATSIPASRYSRITGDVASRAIRIASPFTSYLVPNFYRVTNLKVRQALALATDRAGYVGALGGKNAATPALTIVSPGVPGHTPNPTFGRPEGGDVDGARALLEGAGEPMPYPITLTYPSDSAETDKAFAALKDTYDRAGFDVELEGLDRSTAYGDAVQTPDSDSDLIWGGWGADWPSIATVIPPLFDSRINLTPTSNGQDYGNYASDEANALMDAAAAEPDLDRAVQLWTEVDGQLAEDVAYIPLSHANFYFLRGSNIANYVNAVSTSGYPDLAVISLYEPDE